MLHENEEANLQRTLERTRAALGAFMCMESELRTIRRGMAPSPEKARVDEMIRLNRDTVAVLERKVTVLLRKIARQTPTTDGAVSTPDGMENVSASTPQSDNAKAAQAGNRGAVSSNVP